MVDLFIDLGRKTVTLDDTSKREVDALLRNITIPETRDNDKDSKIHEQLPEEFSSSGNRDNTDEEEEKMLMYEENYTSEIEAQTIHDFDFVREDEDSNSSDSEWDGSDEESSD